MEGDRIQEILLEVIEGRTPENPDTKEESNLREKLETEVAQIADVQGVVMIPSEIADLP